MADTTDIGSGFNYRFFTEQDKAEPTGIVICGPAGPNCEHKGVSAGADLEQNCGGGLHFDNSEIAKKGNRPTWQVVQLEPLTITPSIVCGCGDQHGWITDGKYVKA